MNLNVKRFIILFTLFILILTPITVSAYSKSYSFDIGYRVVGKTKFNLKAKTTSTEVTADTYYANGKKKKSKSSYKVYLNKGLSSKATANIPANGLSYKKSFGKVKKGKYKVEVIKTKKGGKGDRVKGKGEIIQ
ncbi:MAG: hypothetical protein ACFWT6_14895 [Virgibacillus proomii]|jgi:DNA-directed RNA polymerase alpha subunit